jgi:NADH-quinone oxidoreductase subunit L
MTPPLWLVPALPLLGAVLLIAFGRRLPRTLVSAIGVGSVGASAVVSLALLAGFHGAATTQSLWRLLEVDGFAPEVALRLDALSLVMIVIVSFVGFWIHLYSTEFMATDPGYTRFFAYMNLFVASMLLLVLASDLLLLYAGWEGVGLSSYLLIGFWYQNADNGHAARKAFLVTRVGDTAMAIGLFLLFGRLGTLDIAGLLEAAPRAWPVGSAIAVLTAALLLAGALGKSAQLPLHTWLPDAMAGPTPVSALIHAATMVTAGVYLVARLHPLFALAPLVMLAIGVIGAATLLLAAGSALVQSDIKRVLAYSTMSQIGYMFLALGAGAWAAAIFHLVTHAFFKALLFLGAGVVTQALHHEQDIHRMGGLRRRLPLTFWTFSIGGAALAGLPLVTAGFYSKDWILWEAWNAPSGGPWLWLAGWLGAVLTAVYVARVITCVFLGEERGSLVARPGWTMQAPLVVLAAFSVAVGFLEVPHTLGGWPLFSHFMASALPAAEAAGGASLEGVLQIAAAMASIGGLLLGWRLYRDRPAPAASPVARAAAAGWGFDRLYDVLFVGSYVALARALRGDVLDVVARGPAAAARGLSTALRATQTGRLRWYATALVAGSVAVIALVLLS